MCILDRKDTHFISSRIVSGKVHMSRGFWSYDENILKLDSEKYLEGRVTKTCISNVNDICHRLQANPSSTRIPLHGN